MKKIFSFLIVLSIFNVDSIAQEKVPFRAGLKASPTIGYSSVDGSDFKSSGIDLRFSGGLITEIGLTKNYSLLTGLEVLNLGSSYEFKNPQRLAYTTSDNEVFQLNTRDVSLNYINLPVHFKMATNQFGDFRYYASAGLDLGILTRARANDNLTNLSNGSVTKLEQVNVDDDFLFLRLGINVGAGVIYNLSGDTDLVFGINWLSGVLNGFNSESSTLTRDVPVLDGAGNTQNSPRKYPTIASLNAIQITVGILF